MMQITTKSRDLAPRATLLLLLLLLLLGTASCPGFIPAAINDASRESSPTITLEQVKAAEAKGDVALLQAACYRKHKERVALDAWDEACRGIIRDAETRGDRELLIAICQGKQPDWPARGTRRHACDPAAKALLEAFEQEAQACPNVIAAFDKYRAQIPKQHEDELFIRTGLRAARCGYWDHFWGKMVHWGQKEGVGYQLLLAAEKNGIDVEGALLSYLKANASSPFAFQHGGYAVSHITSWLLNTGKTGCERFVPYAGASSRGPLAEWLHYFAQTNCAGAAPLAVQLLAHDRASRRLQACALLGKIGTREHLKKLKIIADSDAAFRVEGGVKVYHVRDACKAAMGKIELRH